ncbi:TauD/TfdA family dioxygenase [Actinocorallia sp. API 0066]|uniref:TauD/TfdA family dioxygenase n=1 Tax=Actinocorallia sp. API 0066 TaxID=2896846 RepID=UPI001E362CC7|nr:TauD/TfdA family dioxygenase [Actinocorallia sp. API 0066]MCD0448023.1 TauD/TfdA family dioxygenase [Actinocorallia sp. API 0066]
MTSVLVGSADLPLTSNEVAKITDLAKYVSADPELDPEEFCHEAARAAVHLPNRVAEALRGFRRSGSATGVLTFSGLPVGDLPPTPEDNTRNLGMRTLLARVQAIFNEFLGSMVAYQGEGTGLLFQDMVPARSAARVQTSMSSAVELEVHTEQAFSDLRPDYLSLACLRGDPAATTYAITARQLVAYFTREEVDTLREPLWTTTIDLSFLAKSDVYASDEVRGPMPILRGAPDDPFLLLDLDLMRGVTAEARELLKRIGAFYRAERTALTLAAGDLVFIDNLRAAHGRSEFLARFDGTDRFVIRSFAVRDLTRSRHARPGDCRRVLAVHS